jgi:hypothetical protein
MLVLKDRIELFTMIGSINIYFMMLRKFSIMLLNGYGHITMNDLIWHLAGLPYFSKDPEGFLFSISI